MVNMRLSLILQLSCLPLFMNASILRGKIFHIKNCGTWLGHYQDKNIKVGIFAPAIKYTYRIDGVSNCVVDVIMMPWLYLFARSQVARLQRQQTS